MMVRRLRPTSIRAKLLLTIFSTCAAALLIAVLVVTASEVVSVRRALVRDVSALAAVLARNGTAALSFDDAEHGRETLSSLSDIDHIIQAEYLTSSGVVFSSYRSAGRREDMEDESAFQRWGMGMAQPEAHRFENGKLRILRQVSLNGRNIGWVCLASDLSPISERLHWLGAASAGAFVLAVLAAWALASRFQKVLSRPIFALLDTMEQVSESGNYALRASRATDDELGRLVTGFNGMLETIEDRDAALERAVESLQEANASAERASRAKSQFVATMSHEVRTPMNGVLGMLDLLGRCELGPRPKYLAETARQSAEQLLALLNDILDFSKIEAGKVTFESMNFDVRELLGEVLRTFSETAREKGIGLSSYVPGSIPTLLRGDPMRLRQILSNLVGNAVKFTPGGRIEIHSSVTEASSEGLWLRVEVRDTGIGMVADVQESIFDSFSQADSSTTRRYGGTGLGLAITKQLVQLMGGQIGVDSEPGKGSVFWFTACLAYADPAEPVCGISDVRQKEDEEPIVLPPARILLVEDNPVNRDVVAGMLEAFAQIRVDVAADGAQGVAAVESERYDLVLMDCQMPTMDGYEATRRIRQWEAVAGGSSRVRRLPVLALTGNTMQGDREKCLEAGMDDHLGKPMRRRDLLRALQRWLADGRRDVAAVPEAREASGTTASPLDPKILEELRAMEVGGAEGLVARVIDAFLDSSPALVETIGASAASENLEALRKAAHALKSSSANLGARTLQQLCHDLEQRAGSGQISPALAGLASSAKREYDRVSEALERLCR